MNFNMPADQDSIPADGPKVPKKPKSKLLAWAVFILIALSLAAAGYMYWASKDKQEPDQTNKQSQFDNEAYITKVNEQYADLISQSALGLPKVTSLTPIKADEFPKANKIFILEGGREEKYQAIKYEGGKVGYYARYTVASSTIQDLISKLMLGTYGSKWQNANAISSSLFGYNDLKNADTGSLARVMFYQKDKNVEIIIQTLNKP